MPFQTKKIADVGTEHPVVARLTYQWFEIFNWFDLPKARRDAFTETTVFKLQPLVIESQRIAESLLADLKSLPEAPQLRARAEDYLEKATRALREFSGVFALLLTRDAPTANYAALAKWAKKHFGAADPLTRLLKTANEQWIRRLVDLRAAAAAPENKGRLVYTVAGAEPSWHVPGEPAAAIAEDLRNFNRRLFEFCEEAIMTALRHVRRLEEVSFVEIPEVERDPAAPVRFRAVFAARNGQPVAAGRMSGQKTVVPELQRMLQQGRGRPIIAMFFNGGWFVATGSELHHSPRWKTFHDFLLAYIRIVLGGEWANLDLKKSRADRHQLMNWYQDVVGYMNARIKVPGTPSGAPMTSLVAAYLGLAYNLYLISHNNGKVHDLLVHRLKQRNGFLGAYQETVAAGIMIRAGFDLTLEDETDSTSSHCEFTAIHRASGQKFSVEAKIRQSVKHPPDVGDQLHKALKKKADHPRVVFIEVNSSVGKTPEEQRAMLTTLLADMRQRESTMTIAGQPMPPAYLVVSNNPPGTVEMPHQPAFMIEGFKIPDFRMESNYRSLREGLAARERHVAMFALVDSLHEHQRIPASFDGELSAFAFRQPKDRLLIGHKYRMATPTGEVVGYLVEAHVLPQAKKAFCMLRTETGQSNFVEVKLTEQEMAAYHESPRTFFGRAQEEPGAVSDAFKLYDGIHAGYRSVPKDQLLQQLAGLPEFAELAAWSQEQLAARCAEQTTESILYDAYRSRRPA